LRKLRRFDYIKPETVAEAVSILGDFQEEASLLAGGTDLLVSMKLGAKDPRCVVDIKGIGALDSLSWNPTEGLQIGALATLRTAIAHKTIRAHFPILVQAALAIGHPQIRSRATVAGNVSTASPSSDMAPSLLALEAVVNVSSPAGERAIPMQEIFVGPFRTVLIPEDMITGIQVPSLPPRTAGVYRWLPKITGVDETLVGVAAVVTLSDADGLKDVRLGLGSVASTPMRARQAEEFLKGKEVHDAIFQEGARIAAGETQPRTRADYRREMTRLLVEQVLREAASQASRNQLARSARQL
jgi:carbon-monoxide dehydrogenase medium subunit